MHDTTLWRSAITVIMILLVTSVTLIAGTMVAIRVDFILNADLAIPLLLIALITFVMEFAKRHHGYY